ncbi:MAG: DNA-3-methyladenine glycosylase I [Candidatus Thermoplasmatota archaeon]|nr:DNA-3-methyladenine glycosylase I [Candidatus Thermoplasmatota archaeon]
MAETFPGDDLTRCDWGFQEPLMLAYHDEEWGVPLHDDQALYELLVLEGMQAGLSWMTVLRKRANFREAMDGFDPSLVARYSEGKMKRLLGDAGIIRNRMKLEAAINNAQRFPEVQEESGSFDAYLWRFVGGRPKVNRFATLAELPPETDESWAMSQDLRQRGFRFVGPTICYAYMQGAGLVNDHTTDCFRHAELIGAR